MTGGQSELQRWPWRWHVAQAGGREHFAVPRALQLTSTLAALYTGFWNPQRPGLVKRLLAYNALFASQRHEGLEDDVVESFDAGMLAWRAHRAYWARPKTIEQIMKWEVANSRWFDRRTLKAMCERTLNPSIDCFFGFQSECMETLQALRDMGVITILDQASAGRTEEDIAEEESRKWPGWANASLRVPEPYYERVRAEWDAATMILANSEWTRQAIISQGAKPDKIIVVPCVYESKEQSPPPREPHDRPLTILFLGRVILAKGIQYFLEAAALLHDSGHRFQVVGGSQISEKAMKSASANVEFVGHVSRKEARARFRNADLFVFPTLCDGFGMTQIEAMSQGVPVIATPNCGQVVSHGVDGLIVPAADSAALVQAITSLHQDRALLAEMSRCAIEKSRAFNLREYGERVNREVSARRDEFAPTLMQAHR